MSSNQLVRFGMIAGSGMLLMACGQNGFQVASESQQLQPVEVHRSIANSRQQGFQQNGIAPALDQVSQDPPPPQQQLPPPPPPAPASSSPVVDSSNQANLSGHWSGSYSFFGDNGRGGLETRICYWGALDIVQTATSLRISFSGSCDRGVTAMWGPAVFTISGTQVLDGTRVIGSFVGNRLQATAVPGPSTPNFNFLDISLDANGALTYTSKQLILGVNYYSQDFVVRRQ